MLLNLPTWSQLNKMHFHCIFNVYCMTHVQFKSNKKSQSNLGRATSAPLMAENNHTTVPIGYNGMPTFTPKTAPSPSTISTPNGIQIQSAILPQSTHRTDRLTDRHTDRWDRQQVCSNIRLSSIDCIAMRLIIIQP